MAVQVAVLRQEVVPVDFADTSLTDAADLLACLGFHGGEREGIDVTVDALEHLKRIDDVDRYARYIQRVNRQMSLVSHSLIELVLFDQHAEEGAEIGDGANDGLGFSGVMPEIDQGTEEGIDDGDCCRR